MIKFNFDFDKVMSVMIMLLSLFGLLMVYEASAIYSDRVFGGKYNFLILQSGWLVIGLLGMLILSQIDLQLLKKYSPYIFGIALFFLILVLLPSIFSPSIYGARRWLIINPAPFPQIPGIGRIGFQPSEFAKLSSIIFFAAFLSSFKQKDISAFKYARNFTLALVLVCGLIFLEPDFTTAFILGLILVVMYFFSNGAMLYFFIAGPVFAAIAGIYAFSSPYRRARIQTLINPDSVDKSGAAYHIRQIMIALGSGGFWGLGLGKSRQKYAYLPEVTSDSIFAIIGEELGFIGATLVVMLFLGLILRGFKIARNCQDTFQMLLVSGVMLWISIQTLINLGAMARIIPLTGIPLPLISYGGSSTIFLLWGLGLVLNASKNAQSSIYGRTS